MFDSATKESFKDGQVIFEEGSSGDWIYVILSGSVEISKTVNNKKFIIEVKPKNQCKPPPKNPKRKTKKWFGRLKTWGINEAKWKFATEWCENNDMEFKILTEDHLGISYK